MKDYNLVKTIAQRPDKKIYVDGDVAIKQFDETYSTSNVLNEALNHARVEETGLCIPKLHKVVVEDNKWAIVSDYIKGETLESLMKSDAANIDKYLEMFVDIQLEIHSKRSPLLSKLKDKMMSKISQANLDATTRYELHTRLEGMPKHNKLCHGDYNPSNVIISADGTPYVVDWAHATQGNASADVARTNLYFKLRGEDELAEKYIKLFCAKSDTARQYVEKWLPIVAASQSVKGKEVEREALLEMVDVVDYE